MNNNCYSCVWSIEEDLENIYYIIFGVVNFVSVKMSRGLRTIDLMKNGWLLRI